MKGVTSSAEPNHVDFLVNIAAVLLGTFGNPPCIKALSTLVLRCQADLRLGRASEPLHELLCVGGLQNFERIRLVEQCSTHNSDSADPQCIRDPFGTA